MVSKKTTEFKHYIDTNKVPLYNSWRKAQLFLEKYLASSDLEYQVIIDNHQTSFRIHFSPKNFEHLLGIKYSSSSFWKNLSDNKISWDSISTPHHKYYGNASPLNDLKRKTQAISALNDLVRPGVLLSLDASLMYVNFDISIRSKKQLVTMLFKRVNNYYVPISLMSLSTPSEITNFYQDNSTTLFSVAHIIQHPHDKSQPSIQLF